MDQVKVGAEQLGTLIARTSTAMSSATTRPSRYSRRCGPVKALMWTPSSNQGPQTVQRHRRAGSHHRRGDCCQPANVEQYRAGLGTRPSTPWSVRVMKASGARSQPRPGQRAAQGQAGLTLLQARPSRRASAPDNGARSRAAGGICLRPYSLQLIPVLGPHACGACPGKISDLLERLTHRIEKSATSAASFCRLLFQRIHGRLCQAHRPVQPLHPGSHGPRRPGHSKPHISFDTHAYLCHERLRSKLADVLISDPARQVFLFIETKYLGNWTYAADVAKGWSAWTRSSTPIRSRIWQTPASITLC